MGPKFRLNQSVWYNGQFGRVAEVSTTVVQKNITYVYTVKFPATGETKTVFEKNLEPNRS